MKCHGLKEFIYIYEDYVHSRIYPVRDSAATY